MQSNRMQRLGSGHSNKGKQYTFEIEKKQENIEITQLNEGSEVRRSENFTFLS